MRKKWMLILLGAGLLAGCRTRYDVTLNSGSVIIARSKPRLKGSYYVFKDGAGREVELHAFRVRQIEARSAGAKSSEPFIGQPRK